jgi:hypothetical protein
MLSTNFWYGFALGAGLIFLIFGVPFVIARARAKSSN